MTKTGQKIAVIGAGIGGLSAAIRLAAAGNNVQVFESHDHVGGKMRSVPSQAGPIDAGPTVLTMRDVFDDLFENAGTRLDEHVTLTRQDVLARHWWSDGSTLDLFADRDRNVEAITALAGSADAKAFSKFCDETQRLFDSFEAPMMRAGTPSRLQLVSTVLRNPALLKTMSPFSSMAGYLARRFRDPRLRQLFGRYATYVGGSPHKSPALLALIWQAEARGVWTVDGGMHSLASAMGRLLEERGGQIINGTAIQRVELQNKVPTHVTDNLGMRHAADVVIFNGDPRALQRGMLGDNLTSVVAHQQTEPRSHSAFVWSFSATAAGVPLEHHNVFFGDVAQSEFIDLSNGQMPSDPTLYVCAQDRGTNRQVQGPERFEIIMNGPPGFKIHPEQEFDQCHTRTFQRLRQMGLTFDPRPGLQALATPRDFATLFPGSAGSLYGRSPHGLTASLKRPTARTAQPGFYLAGGGAHPGAGVPMAALSGKHAAEAIMRDQISISKFRKTDTHGGMSTASQMTVRKPSQSSAS
ncbi:MAG: 1-hydroxycarotenoid 3,4-desaturase CrtD [Pseudomonadota bacterium]